MDKLVRIDNRSGLVLEGGGMRGVFTCGVLDNFMDMGILYDWCQCGGVQWSVVYVGSAGTCQIQ